MWIVGACALSFVGAYMQYFGAIQMGFRHRTHSIPLVGNLWFFAHDTTYVANFHHWFHESDFWLMHAFWFALVVFAICESVVTYQILRYSRRELFPGMNIVCWRALKTDQLGVRTISWTISRGSSCIHTRTGYAPCSCTSSWVSESA